MISKLSIKKAENDEDLLEVALLKQVDDFVYTGEKMQDDFALNNVLNLKDLGYDFLIAKLNDKPVGYAIGKYMRNVYRSEGIYVDSEYRQKGIATKIKKEQIKLAKKYGAEIIMSYVESENNPSINFQKKLGFTFEEKKHGYDFSMKLK